MNRKSSISEPNEGPEVLEHEALTDLLTDEERFAEPEWLEWFALTPQQRSE